MKKRKYQRRKVVISILLIFVIMVASLVIAFLANGNQKEIVKNDNLELQSKANNDNISAYDEKQTYGYIVEYYYDGDRDDELTETGRAEAGTRIDHYEDKKRTGYKLQKTSNFPLTVNEEEELNKIKVYYVKQNFNYAIEYYYDGDRDDNLTEEGVTAYGTKIKPDTSKNLRTGYKVESVSPLQLTVSENEDNNVIRIYYVKNTFKYTIQYYYDGKIDNDETEEKTAVYGTKISTYDDKIRTGYSLSGRPNTITISEQEDENIIKVYYTRNTYSYTVQYYYDGKIDNNETETLEGKYGEEINEYPEKQKQGYKFKTVTKIPFKITEDENRNVIKVYYVIDDENKKSLSYTIQYYKDGQIQDEDTEIEVQTVQILESDNLTVNKNNIDTESKYLGYTFEKTVPKIIPDTIETGSVIKVYYKLTPVEVSSVELTKVGTPELTDRNDRLDYKIKYIARIDNYIGRVGVYIEDSLPYGIDTSVSSLDGGVYSRIDNTVVWDLDLGNVNTFETGRNVTKIIKVEKNITVLYKNVDLLKDFMVSNVKVGLYLPAQNVLLDDNRVELETGINVKGQVNVKYLDRNTNEEILETLVKEDKVGNEFDVTGDVQEIRGYTLVEEPAVKTGLYKEEKQEKIYYYAKNSNVNVKYVDKATNQEITNSEVISGYEGQEYETKEKAIENYTFVEATSNTKGVMTNKTIQVTYYYSYNSKVIVQYIDKETDSIIESIEIPGLEGNICETVAKEISEYILFEEPDEKNVKMKKEEVIVKYYYAHVSNGVLEKHIDQITNQILLEKVHEGKEGDKYRTEEKTFKGYDFMPESYPANSVGNMTTGLIEVKYYYKKKATVIAEYIDKITGDKIVRDVKIEGHENDTYTTEAKTFEGYKLVESPENAKGKMKVTVNEDGTFSSKTIVKYYYVHLSAGVDEKHIDEMSGNVLAQTHYDGDEGDEYNTEEKEFPGYKINKNKYPENAKGKMKVELTEVVYYYKRQAKLKVQYVNKETGEILEKIEIDGCEGDDYDTIGKDFEGYEFVEVYGDVTGKLEANVEKLVTYYYIKTAKVITKYIDEETNQEISEETVQLGHKGDEYTTSAKKIENYVVSKLPNNATGKMDEVTNVVYYYRKARFDMSISTGIKSVTKGKSTKNMKNSEIAKVEIDRKKTDTTNVDVVFNITVKNTGEIPGKATISNKVPDYFRMYEKDNKGWKVTDNVGTITTDEIAPGKSKTYTVKIRWLAGDANMGVATNKVSIDSTENALGYEQTNKKNDTDEAQVIVSVSTGIKKISMIVGVVLAYFAVIGIINKRIKGTTKSNKKRKNK